MLNLDKLVKYPPEVVLEGVVSNIPANAPYDLINYQPTAIGERVLFFMNPSFSIQPLNLKITYDSYLHEISTLSAAKGLDYEEELKLPATSVLKLTFLSTSSITYAFRYKLAVYKKTPLLKHVLGLPLSESERRKLNNVIEAMQIEPPRMRDPMEGIEKLYTVTSTTSGTVLDVYPKKGEKVVLLSLSVQRPSSTGSAYVTISRDDVDFDPIDAYTLPSLQYNYIIKIVALKELRITTNASIPIRVVYGTGKITIPEKIRWNIPLTSEENEIAEKYGIREKVEAGLY
jgi:hypothetical protein